MARFTTRVELHYGDEDDYEKLHTAMEKEGFSRVLVADKGKRLRLPTAEYDRQGNLTKEEVLKSAKKAASRTGLAYAILVTESNGIRTSYGLSEA